MTVTLSPEQADLLAQVGHTWPTADEEQLAAMAHGWHALGVGLDEVRGDHLDTTRSAMAAGTGDAVAAFGDWGADLAGLLLPMVETCARVEAWLISIARTVYEAKTAIVGVLDRLARQIDQIRRDLADVPLVGGALAAPVGGIVEPFYTGARAAITGIVDRVSSVVIDTIVPALVAAVEWVKGAVQGLRKLIRFEIGADWPTTPTSRPNPANRPRGTPEIVHPNDKGSKPRDARLENEAAVTLAQAGYDVEQLEQKPDVPGRKNPDYRIDGKVFDCLSPTTPRARNIWDRVRDEKVNQGQADRVIINIDAPDAQADVADLRRQFQDYPIPGLKEAKVIAPGGAIIDIYP